MNRQEFISALRKELSKLPPEEIVEATQYFEEIFEDATAGMDDGRRLAEEQRLTGEFGKPKKIAANIKADYAARILEGTETVEGKKPGTGKKLSAVWWVIIGICSAPVSIPLAIGVITMVITIIGAILSLYGGIIAAILSGMVIIVFGFVCLTSSVASGLMTIGGGLLLLAGSVAAAGGAFIGTRALILAIAKAIREANKKRKLSKMAGENSNYKGWTFTEENTEAVGVKPADVESLQEPEEGDERGIE